MIKNLLHIANRHFTFLLILIVLADGILNFVIINKVPYTEIDWATYMQQIVQFLNGERNYCNILGDTGPLVYPSGFVYVFSLLHYLTDDGTNIYKAQIIFAGFYVMTLLLIFTIYKKTNIPIFYYFLLMLSKRIHSIYILRLFNDPVAMMLLYSSIALLIHKHLYMSSIFYSLALSIKMNILLFLPGYLFILFVRSSLRTTIYHVLIMMTIQTLLALPFVDHLTCYLSNAFNFRRAFIYKWSVNWKFFSEGYFNSNQLSYLLLFLHVTLLFYFIFRHWARVQGESITNAIRDYAGYKHKIAKQCSIEGRGSS